MLIEINALVVRTVDLSESDRLLSLYSAEKGKITAVAKGMRSLKNKARFGGQLFCYSRFILYRKGDKFWVKEAELIEHFYDLRLSLARTALASYVCDVLSDVATAEPDPALLRLALNTLHAISTEKYELSLIKAAFEFRMAANLGFLPDISSCADCGKETGDLVLDLADGILYCPDCRAAMGEFGQMYPDHEDFRRRIEVLTPAVRASMQYVAHAPVERLFSFRLAAEDKEMFLSICERYLIYHLERTYKSLAFYHEVKE